MPRSAREVSKTGIYHVMMRGIDKREIFLCENDYNAFMHFVTSAKEKSKFSIFAYCLMPNHVHLLIKEGEEKIGDSVRRINVGYAQYHNNKHGRTGHLFQNRFLSETVNDETYLLVVLRYIHQNPVKANIVDKAMDYKWSSYNEYFKLRDTHVDYKIIMDYFGSRKQFSDFHALENEDACLDYNENTKYSDEELYDIVKSEIEPEKIKTLDIEARNELIKRIKSVTTASARQLERVTGVSRNTILKVK